MIPKTLKERIAEEGKYLIFSAEKGLIAVCPSRETAIKMAKLTEGNIFVKIWDYEKGQSEEE
jgi:hypothetical protein